MLSGAEKGRRSYNYQGDCCQISNLIEETFNFSINIITKRPLNYNFQFIINLIESKVCTSLGVVIKF